MADSKQTIISLRSVDRKHGSIDNFECEINSLSNVHWLQIQDMTVMLSHYQIDATNNVLTFSEGAGDLTAILKNGNYSTSEIIAELKSKLDASGALVYTVTIDNINNKMTIASTGNYELKWTLNAPLASMFGFNATDLSGSATYTGQGIINLNRRFSSFNIYSNQITKYHGSVRGSDLKGSLVFRAINAVSSPLTHFHYTQDQHTNYLIKYSPDERLRYIDIRITDLDNKAIEFNGVDEVIVNMIAYIRN